MRGLAGPIDLDATMRSGQLFHWRSRPADGGPADADACYETTVDGAGVRLYDVDDGVVYEGDADPGDVRRLLGLDADLEAIFDGVDDPRARRAAASHPGLRVVRDDPWRSTVSFLCSPQSSVERIRRLVNRVADAYGDPIDGFDVAAFPSPETIAREADEEALRELKLGYRAEYVDRSAAAVADGAVDLDAIAAMPYEEAHAELRRLHGVGDKVADCILLFGLGFDEAVPIDRWMRRTIERHYPEIASDGYAETADRFRERFGEHAGYVQNVLFHHARVTDAP